MNKLPKVSVVTITYGHQEYILDTIKGVVMQQYDGPIEFIIANDNSPDNTDAVIHNYLSKTTIPDNIDINYTKHQSNKGMLPNFIWTLKQVTGDYIALCEGDDYWIDPMKLSKQVNYLENNQDTAMVFSNAEVIIEENIFQRENGIKELKISRNYTSLEILESWIVPTASVLFRTKFITADYQSIAINKYLIYGDTPLFIYLSYKGLIYGFNEQFVCYRRNRKSATNIKIDINYYFQDYQYIKEIIKIFGKQLESKAIKLKMSDYSLSLFFYSLQKRKFKTAIKFFLQSMSYDRRPMYNYIKGKIYK